MARSRRCSDIELIELDRASCCGAGVIAEHNQELADTLNARTFAMAQQTDGELMMNICSTCQGAQTRVPGAPGRKRRLPRADQRHARLRGAALRAGRHEQELPLAAGRGDRPGRRCAQKVKRPLTNLRVGPFYGCYIVRPAERLGIDDEHPRHRYLEQVIDALGGTVIDYAGSHKCCGFPIITMNKTASLQAGRPPSRRRGRRRGRLRRHPVPAVPPEPRPAAAARRGASSGAS